MKVKTFQMKYTRDLYKEKRKKRVKKKKKGIEGRIVTIDLQVVLLSSKVTVHSMYYKTKLACQNFTVDDLTSKNITC